MTGEGQSAETETEEGRGSGSYVCGVVPGDRGLQGEEVLCAEPAGTLGRGPLEVWRGGGRGTMHLKLLPVVAPGRRQCARGMRELPVGRTGEAVLRVWGCTVLPYSYVPGVQEGKVEGLRSMVLRPERERVPWVLWLPNGDPWETGS